MDVRFSLARNMLSSLGLLVILGHVAFAQSNSSLADTRPCGPDNIPQFLKFLIPQGFKGADFRDACRRHDRCYSTSGISKQQCDMGLKKSVLNECKNSSSPLRCKMRARVMYWLVRYTGGAAFRSSRRGQSGNGYQSSENTCVCRATTATGEPHHETPIVSVRSDGARIWTDNTGEHQCEAIFLGLSDGNVKLRRASTGATMTVPLDLLSHEDQQFALKLANR